MASDSGRAVTTRTIGQAGEAVAVDYLRRRGMSVVATNLRSRLGELDILARDGATLVFVEVKARRAGPGDPPQAAVDARKRARITRLAQGYLAGRRLGERRCRFDVVAVTFEASAGPGGPRPSIRHFPGAFGLDAGAG